MARATSVVGSGCRIGRAKCPKSRLSLSLVRLRIIRAFRPAKRMEPSRFGPVGAANTYLSSKQLAPCFFGPRPQPFEGVFFAAILAAFSFGGPFASRHGASACWPCVLAGAFWGRE